MRYCPYPLPVFVLCCLCFPPSVSPLSFLFPPSLHVISFLFTQDYESKLQALQRQVETRSLAAETTEEEEEEEEEGESWALVPFQSWAPWICPALYCPCTELAATPGSVLLGGGGLVAFLELPRFLSTVFTQSFGNVT